MKQNLLFFFVIFLCISPCIIADDNANAVYLYSRSSTAATKFSLDKLDKITFTSSGISFWSKDYKAEFSFEDFRLITFSEYVQPAVDRIHDILLSQDVSIRYEVAVKEIVVESSKALNSLGVYDLQGRLVANVASVGTHYRLSLASLPLGIYIVKVKHGSETLVNKIVKQ